MSYLLDTNVCVRFLNGRAPLINKRLAQLRDTDIFVCSIVKAEMYAGAQRSIMRQNSAAYST